MPLVKGAHVVEDRFLRVQDGDPVPEDVPALIPAVRLLADVSDFTGRTAPLGVLWPNDRKVSELAPFLGRLALVALAFPVFRDGRAYSQARQLREHHGFRGELRATGDVLRDQFLFLLRAGFDSLEVKKDADASAFAEAAQSFTVFYQPTQDGRVTALQKRVRARPQASAVTKREDVR